jgi:hypothetical protein
VDRVGGGESLGERAWPPEGNARKRFFMSRALGRLVRHTLGWALLVLGIAGLVLPVLQGWLFIALAALLLAPDVPVFARLTTWIENRFPVLRHPIQRMRARLGHRERPSGDSSV